MNRDPNPSLRYMQGGQAFHIPAMQEKGPSMTETTEQIPQEFVMGALLSDIRSRISGEPTTDPDEQDEYISELRQIVMAGLLQARRDAFDLMREILREPGQDDRWTFLQYCVDGFMTSGQGGSPVGFEVYEYDSGLDDHELRMLPGLAGKERREAKGKVVVVGDDFLDGHAIRRAVEEGDPEHPAFDISHKTIETGLEMIRSAVDMPDTGTGNWERRLTSIAGLSRTERNQIIRADLTNEATDLDAITYAAIVEIALFGEVRFG